MQWISADNVGKNKSGLCWLNCTVLAGCWLAKAIRKRLNIQLELLSIKEGHAFGIFIGLGFFFSLSTKKLSYFQFIFGFFCRTEVFICNLQTKICENNGISFVFSVQIDYVRKRLIFSHLQTISILKMHQTFKISNDFVFVFYNNESSLSSIKSVVGSQQSTRMFMTYFIYLLEFEQE